jgi:hypothetical protein
MSFACIAAAIIPVAAAYSIDYRLAPHDPSVTGLFSWITWHSPDSGFAFHPITNLGYTARGTLRLFFGGKVGDLARDGVSKAALTALAIAIVVLFAAVWKAVRAGGQRFGVPAFHLLVWAGIYLAFLFFWMPQNTFYRLFYLAPVVLVLALTVRD